GDRPLFLVAFDTRQIPERAEPASGPLPEGEMHDRVMELEQEVSATREHLQTVVEELEISNEEMQSLNEELSSTNEELQASNEELETTNEEMQASNEELTTLNEELNSKSAELRMANSNMENILSSIDAPVLVVDNEMRLLRYNAASNQIFNVAPSDYGEVIARVSSQSEIEGFEEKVKETIRTGQITEGICRTARRVYQMRIHPNRDENRRISGAVLVFFDNTDLMAAEEHLRKSDARIRAVIDGSPSSISLKDSMGRYQLVNRAFLELYGKREADVLDRSDRELFTDAMANHIRDQDLEVLLRRQAAAREERLAINGEERVFFTSRFPLFSPGDKNPHAVGTVSHEITAQVRAQTDLQESQTRYRAIVEDQAVFVCRHMPDGHLNFTNGSFCAYFGGSPESNRARDFLSVVDSTDQRRVAAQLAKLSPEHPIAQYEHRVPALSTAPARWVRWIHRALFDEHGRTVEFQAVGFDVTEIHNQTADLLKKENLFTQVLEHTSDIVTVYRVEEERFILESFNQSAADSGSFSQARLLGRSLQELSESSRAEEVTERYAECARTGRVLTFEEQAEAPGGIRYLSTTLVPIRDYQGKVERITALSRDITRLKRAENSIREEKLNAENANRAKSDFLAAISHELRTPLNVITGICYLLNREQLKPNHQRLVDSIQRSSKVLLSLIDDVLDLSKIEAGKVSIESAPFSLDLLFSDLTQAFEPQATAKGIKYEAQREFPEHTDLVGDSSRLRQVLINLVANALKFTEKGSVSVRFSLEEGGEAPCLRLEVKDTGVGIPEASYPKIFQRFSQAESGTSRRFGGTGLGLAISKQLVELMNGEIGFTSKFGAGTTFWVELRLPRAATPVALIGPPVASEADAKRLSELRVLGVDDTAEALNVLKLALEKDCREVVTVGSGQEAIGMVRSRPFDVILLDVQMPDMDGFETTRRIRALDGPARLTPIIALTANAMSGDEARCRDAGMNDYLTKPVDFEKLREKMLFWKEKGSS
ncbi:MAG: PAS domain S-box protein, partial [Proteobacteria bacterium]